MNLNIIRLILWMNRCFTPNNMLTPNANAIREERVEEIISIVEKFCDQETRGYPDDSHNLAHHRAVDWNTRIIAWSENITDPIVLLMLRVGALVHDIVDYKYCSPKLAGQPTIEEKQARLREFLYTIPELQEWVSRILMWTNNMSFSKEKQYGPPNLPVEDTLYRNILSDADKWEALGPVGIERCRTYHLMLEPTITPTQLIKEVCEHMEEKILILHEYCRTELGKKRAIELTKPIREWYDTNSTG